MQRQIVIVDTEAMMNDKLFRAMKLAPKDKLAAYADELKSVASERVTFEAGRERKDANGNIYVGQSNDIRHLIELAHNESAQRMLFALKVDPRSYLFPQSQSGGKSSSETSNLKAYKKAREVAECVYTGSSSLENVAKVFTVCAFKATNVGHEVLQREFAETFLSSRELRSISQGSEELWNALDEVRARHMSTGAATQASQMIRTLVALKSAEDVRDGRSKNVRVDADGKVMQALMRRFGQVTEVAA